MMTSFVENIPVILNIAVALKPRRILDVGSGFGKFGLLLAEALLSLQSESGELEPTPEFRIDCVEQCDFMIRQPAHDALYLRHYHQDLFSVPLDDDFALYDLILLIDVVEHHEKAKILRWIRDARVAAPRSRLIVSTPKKVCFYKEHYYGRDCPLHVSQWAWADFEPFPHEFVDTKNSYIAVIK